MTVPRRQRPRPQWHVGKIRIVPSKGETRDPKAGREENATLERRNLPPLFIRGKVDVVTLGQAHRKLSKSFSILKHKAMPGAIIHLQISTFSQPGSVLGTWEAKTCEPLLQPQEIPVQRMVGRVSIWFPHQMETTMRCGGGKERGRNDLLLPSLWGKDNPSEPVDAAAALPSWPILPQASCRTTASASLREEGQGHWAGWRCCFPLCLIHNAPEKHFADM